MFLESLHDMAHSSTPQRKKNRGFLSQIFNINQIHKRKKERPGDSERDRERKGERLKERIRERIERETE